ncbi:TPR repeat-containing protein YfgC precursor [Maioricimonas rarisocia]|uniref:TPR repeat-containing protein YfgC n=1 Tax=Maioricimonas rarisocia TaxID=2528026 RepID=A0A517ZE02_9PLAN|nr:M48 family metallopeptidase [Maioricimonas rarisocia]QDU40670.1 TPR repeat-containing protein YfgC precursor [Maioricimonas rarisocia]
MNRPFQPRPRRRPSDSSRRCFASLCLLALLPLAVAACHEMPMTGRQQLLLIPEEQEVLLGQRAYEKILSEQPLSRHPQYRQLVERVGRRIAAAAGRPDFDWEFHVLAGQQQNAFALPGGKVAIYEGMMPICANEAGLAVVLSHEIAHVLARHGAERMSQKSVVRGVGGLIDKVTREQEVPDQEKIVQVYGAASHLGVILPYSRKHETEADSIGLTLMARAGYDPREAPEFWERFAAASSGRPPEFLSTHPSDTHRARHLAGLLAKASTYYEHAETQFGLGEAIPHLPSSARMAARPTIDPQVQPAAVHAAASEATPASLIPAAHASVPAHESGVKPVPTGRRTGGNADPAADDESEEWELPRRTGTEPSLAPSTSEVESDGWVPTGRKVTRPQ